MAVSPLDTPVQYLRGIGPKRAALLERIGVKTVGQLLYLLPRRYIDRSRVAAIGELRVGNEVTVVGRILTVSSRRTRRRRQIVSLLLRDGTGTIEVLWFNRPGLQELFRPGQELLVSGTVTAYRHNQLVNPLFEVLRGDEFTFANKVIPVYPLTEGLSIWTIRRAVRIALDQYSHLVPESLPPALRQRYHYPAVAEALEQVHFPQDVASAEQGRARLVYDELFYFTLLLALRRQAVAAVPKERRLLTGGRLISRFRASLGFALTQAQERVIAEIEHDLASNRCMNRLLQGDVGSGKTVVAVHAMLVAVDNNCQAAMMAPTEILAEQHFRNWASRLADLGVRTALLTGSTKAGERQRIRDGLESGEVQVLFGTHALIEESVRFRQLAVAVVDEQHRFGVLQRAALLAKGLNPDFLVMTATPIPRTLTLTLYGDLDVSILDEKPPGRRPVVTRLLSESRRQEVYGAIERRLAAGEQVFVVCPLIEESEKLDLASAVATFEQTRQALPGRRVGLVHGRLRPEERAALMEEFRSGGIDVLVATSVIEVGVDVPNATVMVIEHAERFGLAQLHQLRGRIGRGERQSYCLLIAGTGVLPETLERLQYFCRTTDGFKLAEKDWQLRGPGELLGTRQHGLPDLQLADLGRDRQLLERARHDAFRLVELDPQLSQPENESVRQTLLGRYAGRAELLRVG